VGWKIWNKFSSKRDMWSHCGWFITNIWKLDHCLNMTLGTDVKFTLSFPFAESLCWWKWMLSYFKTQKPWSEENLNTNRRSLSSDVDSAVLSVSHTSVTSTHFNIPRPAVTFEQLQNCIFLFTVYAPQSPAPLPKLRLTWRHIHDFSQPEGMPSGTEAWSFTWERQRNSKRRSNGQLLWTRWKTPLVLQRTWWHSFKHRPQLS